MNRLQHWVFLSAIALLFFGCRKDDITPPENCNVPSGSKVFIDLDPMVNGAPFQFGTTYTNNLGVAFKFSRADMYLNGFNFTGNPPTTYAEVFAKYLLIRQPDTLFELGNTTADYFDGVHIHFGVDSLTNYGDPSIYGIGEPLALQTPSMHWHWNTGYMFMVLEGQYDSDSDNIPETNFSYHIGLDDTYRSHYLQVQDSVPTDGSDMYVDLNIDYGVFLADVDFAAVPSTDSFDNLPFAMTMADQFLNAISHD